jgi:alkanesulfonate monooxygenase SsuD/methylene tetrahydromethanopterin reductase-like flavin-dependent oxidoreductase (luciferase family)
LRSDYDLWGIPIDPPGTRVSRLAESLKVLKGLWTGEPYSFRGEHYTIDAPAGVARAFQQPHPPLLIGAGGRRMLELAAREADTIGITFNQRAGEFDALKIMSDAGNADEGIHDRKTEWIRAAAGDRFDSLELAVFALIAVTDRREDALAAAAAAQGVSQDWLADAPQFSFGTLDQIADDLERKRERYGVSYIMTPGESFDAVTPLVERLAGR